MQYLQDIDAVYERWKQETLEEGLEKGMEKGLERGLAKGLERGLAKGLEKGRQDTLRRSLLTMFRARFDQEPPRLVAALDVADTERLERWIGLFATGTSDEILRAVQRDD